MQEGRRAKYLVKGSELPLRAMAFGVSDAKSGRQLSKPSSTKNLVTVIFCHEISLHGGLESLQMKPRSRAMPTPL